MPAASSADLRSTFTGLQPAAGPPGAAAGPPLVVLTGRHVRLEPLTLEAVPGLLTAAVEERDTYAYTPVPADEAGTVAYVRKALADEAAGLALPFVTRRAADGRVVGSTRFVDLEYWTGADDAVPTAAGIPTVAEIGSTWLAPSAQRSGVNTEAKLLMLTPRLRHVGGAAGDPQDGRPQCPLAPGDRAARRGVRGRAPRARAGRRRDRARLCPLLDRRRRMAGRPGPVDRAAARRDTMIG